MMIWMGLDPRFGPEDLGYLPGFLSDADSRPAREQLDERYAHGGGYRPFGKGEWQFVATDRRLKYPGDPWMKPVAAATLPGSCETVLLYPGQMLLIQQADQSFTVTRVD